MVANEDLIADLIGSSAKRKRLAAIHAREKNEISFCESLIQALQIELDSDDWRTKTELATTLGVLRCPQSESILRRIVFLGGSEYDLVKMKAAKALIRVSRIDCMDYCKAFDEIFDGGGYSAIEGTLEAIGYDKMVFDLDTCRLLIRRFWDFGKDRPRGYTDPRYGIAAACAGWDKNIVKDFLRQCLNSNDAPLCHVAENSLQGKHTTLRQ
jgi:hypothetical protein